MGWKKKPPSAALKKSTCIPKMLYPDPLLPNQAEADLENLRKLLLAGLC
jgi:hypothetical protein